MEPIRYSKMVVTYCILFLSALTVAYLVLYYVAPKEPPSWLLVTTYGGFCTELALTFATTITGSADDKKSEAKSKTDGEKGKG